MNGSYCVHFIPIPFYFCRRVAASVFAAVGILGPKQIMCSMIGLFHRWDHLQEKCVRVFVFIFFHQINRSKFNRMCVMNHSPQIDSMCNGLYVINIIIIMLVIIGLYISLSRIRSSPGMCNAWLLILSFSASLFLYISHNARVCIFKPRSVHCTRDLIVNRITRIGKRVSQKKTGQEKTQRQFVKKEMRMRSERVRQRMIGMQTKQFTSR